ncbi:hypothetical protein H8356DRAFT_1303972 [Neocallimastix lanati (nom. inval.)]|nr:hypothetical protein H8356DRAFT_1303971 [Neocallimastix sp. JGI-2020a]KAG4104268.1 hypothetical protein H8356DRAFT_1303972 [Neocallimastix sp. JGI-2020a]
MANTKSDFKRRFPRVGKCCCCCCCEPKVSVIVCTIIFIIWYGFGVLFAGIVFNAIDKYNTTSDSIISKGFILLNACALISTILLLIGIIKRNITFMKQFKIVYLIYIICQIFNLVYNIYLYNDDEYIENTIKIMKENNKKNNSQIMKENNIQNNSQKIYEIPDELYRRAIENSMNNFIIVYYYLSTCSYIEDIEEIANKESYSRQLENNEY